MATKFDRDESGGIVNPPIIQSYEQDIMSIAASGDQDRLNLAYEDYREAQEALVTRLEAIPDEDDNDDVVSSTRRQTSSPTGDEDTSSRSSSKKDDK